MHYRPSQTHTVCFTLSIKWQNVLSNKPVVNLFLKVWGNLQELAVDLTGQGWIWNYK